jgi:hypothetical protein
LCLAALVEIEHPPSGFYNPRREPDGRSIKSMTWLLGGNSNVTTTSFLGTTTPLPLVIKTNNKEAMRVASADGDVSIGELGASRSPDYKLDVQGILNADDIYKGEVPLVGSQWTDVTGGINYATGKVGIGKAPGAYKLDVEGVINATDIHKDGAPLSLSQWEEVAGGITYGGGAVGIGKAPSRSYKLDVAGTFNATDILKNGSSVVSSQWKGVTGGISYGAGNVGIGELGASRSPDYKLDVQGILNADDIYKDGTRLVGSQWEDVTDDGISYGAGNVGIGTPDETAPGTTLDIYRDVGDDLGSLHLTTSGGRLLKIGVRADGFNERAFIDYTRNNIGRPLILQMNGGNVGIGTTTPKARLSVVGPGAAEILGTARSSTLLSSAGRLGATTGDELALASIGFTTVNNNVSLGIRGHRAADGPDWPTTAIGLGMDVDDRVRAGASLWLHANGNVGIGTPAPTARLDVSGDMKVAGTLRWEKSIANPDSIELGAPDSSTPGVGTPFIDFHFQGLTQDFNTRLINDADGQLTISAGRLRALGSVAISGNATVGAGSNGVLKVRHIDGKHFQNDNNDPLLLNWNTGQPVIIGQSTVRAPLWVSGDATIGQGSYGVLRTRHIDGKHWQNDDNDGLYLNWATEKPVYIGGHLPASLTISGELFLQYGRISITGFDGAGRGRGYHWIRSDANDNELWMAFAYPFIDENGNEVAPRRIEGSVPFYGTFVNWSDARTKTNVRQLGRALDKLERIRGVTFNWSESPQALGCVPGQPSIGVIAQEVEAVFPELVSAGGTQAYKGVDYSGLTGVLIEAAKELKEDNEALRSRIEMLERA